MKKLITLLIGCSIAAAFGAPADQKKKKPAQAQPHVAPAQPRGGGGGAKPHVQAPRSQPAPAHKAAKMQGANTARVHGANAAKVQGGNAAKVQSANNAKVRGANTAKVHGANAKVHGANVPKQQVQKPSNVQANKKANVPANNVNTDVRNQVNARNTANANVPGANKAIKGAKSPGAVANAASGTMSQSTRKAAAQNIRAQHTNFHATRNTNIASAQFNQGYRIAGAENWRGTHYEAFRDYHPVWHDSSWWHSHYSTVLLIGGGWYFWNAGYWYPAWGYDASAAYYPYDGPIYTGSASRRADQVIADVQAVLQQDGYYQGEVDGLLGPQTRDALASYQSAQGLEPTAAIDEPTLQSLGLA